VKKILGVIGGMGPEASAYFYDEVIRCTKADCDQEHLDMIIVNDATVPDRTQAIMTGDTGEVLRTLDSDIKKLELCGAENIVMTCNTAHYFYDLLQRRTRVPIINMIRESVDEVVKEHGKGCRIGIMATDGTLKSELYHLECRRMGAEPVVPKEKAQKAVMELIYDEIKAKITPDESKFELAMKDFEDCDKVILACTELSVYKKYRPVPDKCLDAMDVLVREAIIRSGGTYTGEC